MKHSTVIAIIDALLSERFSNLELPKGPRGFRGKPGQDFVLQDHIEEVTDIVNTLFDGNKETFKLKFNELTPEEKEELTLKFESLSAEEIKSLRGPRGQKGKSGRFVFEDHQYDIDLLLQEYINTLDLKLTFNDLTDKEKDDLKLRYNHLSEVEKEELKGEIGPTGLRGKHGKDGLSAYDIWLANNDGSELDFLNSLIGPKGKDGERGIQGPRGQRGKVGSTGDSAYEIWLQNNKGTEEDYLLSLKGKDGETGSRGARGPVGPMGLNAPAGQNGKDGLNAPRIVDIELEKTGSDKISFIFKFSDGSVIETGNVSIPTIQQLAYSIVSSGGGGGGLSSINVDDGSTNLDTAEILFNGATVVDNAGVAEVTIDTQLISVTDGVTTETTNDICFDGATVTDNGGGQTKVTIDAQAADCITVLDEGVTVTSCVKSMDFVGATVSVATGTVIADWPTMAAVDFIGTWISGTPGQITVTVDPTADTLAKNFVAGENISALKLVRLNNSNNVFLAEDNLTFNDAKTIGVTTTAALTGQVITVQMFGINDDASFTFNANDPLFLAASGGITDVAPIVGYNVQVGHGLGAGSIFVNIREPISL